MTRRTGELAGHLWSDDPGFRRLMMRATWQTAELARRPGPRIDYMVVPLEARRAMALEVHAMGDREWRRHYLPNDRAAFAGACQELRIDPELELELVCLLPDGHEPPCGWARFLDAAERGELAAQAAEARLRSRFDKALEDAAGRIQETHADELRRLAAAWDPVEGLRRAFAELDLEAGAEDD